MNDACQYSNFIAFKMLSVNAIYVGISTDQLKIKIPPKIGMAPVAAVHSSIDSRDFSKVLFLRSKYCNGHIFHPQLY
jgi:hypothetical protein